MGENTALQQSTTNDRVSNKICYFHMNLFGVNFISLYTHVQNDNVINANEQVNDIQNGIQKDVLGLMNLFT